jgi:hypothetical protein
MSLMYGMTDEWFCPVCGAYWLCEHQPPESIDVLMVEMRYPMGGPDPSNCGPIELPPGPDVREIIEHLRAEQVEHRRTGLSQ